MSSLRRELKSFARLISLLRLLLLAIGLAVLTFVLGGDHESAALWGPALDRLQVLLGSVAVAGLLLVVAVPLVTRSWQLVLHLVFDLLWLGCLIYLSGGVASPAVPLLFAVVLTANLALPRAVPFLMPTTAGLVLAGVATFYLAGVLPFDDTAVVPGHPLINPARILGNLAIQVGALFVVDLLGQSLARRVHEQRMLIGDLIEQLGEGVVACDQRGLVLYANEAASTLVGLGGSIEPGLQVAEALRTVDPEALAETFGAAVLPADTRFVNLEGRHLILRATHLRGRGGRVIGRTLLISDETRLRTLEEDARRVERLAAMGQMAAGIAHEVRNPLASLRGCAQELGTMVAGNGSAEDAQALSRIMVREADRVERIVEDFLRLSRLRQAEIEPVMLSPLFAELGTLVHKRGDRPESLELVAEVSSACPPVDADPDHLRQVLSNLLNNAVEAVIGRPAPRIDLRAELDSGGAVAITVRDNGVGIPADRQDAIFTPFHSTKSKGTGLGLTLVERMAREHGAQIHLRSEAGIGTEVRLLWPAARPFPEE
jgi:signal transduction histidine kinase